MSKSLKVAAIQAEPVWNDLQGGVNKSIGLIQEAAKNGANVIGFPEVFIPGYPWYVTDLQNMGRSAYSFLGASGPTHPPRTHRGSTSTSRTHWRESHLRWTRFELLFE